jgi:hypothetical protein
MVETARWAQRPAGSNWGEFGPDDQLGRLNLIGPRERMLAAREIQEGWRLRGATRFS